MLLARLGLNMLFTAVVVRLVYYRLYRNRDYVFTYFLINLVTFSLAYLLSNVPIELGFRAGSVRGLRHPALSHRSDQGPQSHLSVRGHRDCAAQCAGEWWHYAAELLIANAVIVGTVSILEAAPFSGREESRLVHYDRLDLLSPAAAAELLADLRKRTHLPVERFEIGDVDLLRDSADITVYYRSDAAPNGRRGA